MWIVRLALRRPYTIAVLCSLIAIFGVLSTSRIMPPGITPPVIVRYNASNVPVAQLTISSKTLPEQELFDYGLNFIRLRLFTIPGLATPAPFGGKLRQIMVDIDPARVAAKGLSPNDVVQAVLQSNVLVPAGSAQIGGTRDDVPLNSRPGHGHSL